MSRWRLTYQIVKFFLRHLKTKSAAIIPSTAQADIWSLAREGWEEIIEAMAIRVVRLGSARKPQEGLRIGTVRRPPRGVRKAEYMLGATISMCGCPSWRRARRWCHTRFLSHSRRSAGPSTHGGTGAKWLNQLRGGSLRCWRRCRRGQIFQWAVTVKTKADAIDLC